MRLFTAALALTLTATAAAAQDRPNTILVMDGSGSMWGQIDGVAKITIAQDVVGGLLDTLPGDQRLGLTVYGHRERGNCTDIETIVPPGEGTRDAIRAAVNGIKPLGKTPMTDSIIAAAEALRYTEDSATVILVSDGVETCNPDPCAAARLLEEAGIDFTAHVIGFDIAGDAEALTQMQCIAEETGGRFIPASNADELSSALNTVVEEPEPVMVETTLYAVIDDADGPLVEDPVLWTMTGPEGAILTDEGGNPRTLTLGEGTYDVTAYRLIDEMALSVTHVIDGPEDNVVKVVFPEPTPQASLTTPDTVPAGSVLMVDWTGPDEERDNVQIGEVGETSYFAYTYTSDGNPLPLQMPFDPGIYELRYKLNDREVITTRQIEVTPVPVGLEAPASVGIGSAFEVTWTGPDAVRDNVQIGPVGEMGYSNYVYTDRGNPVTITAPGTPGTYELRYKFLDRQVVYTQPIEVTPAEVTLDFPTDVGVGSSFQVAWDGPDTERDNIQIGPIGETRYSDYAYTASGNPVTLTAPSEPGEYEVRYKILDRDIIATETITVSEVQTGFAAPESAPIGATIQVGWDGPDNDRDYISVGEPGEDRYINYTYTREGNPLELLLPVEPGTYEIRYQLREGNEIIATQPIEVTDLKGSLTAPETAAAGSTITVGWDGPDYDRDYIGVGLPGERYMNYSYTREGNPLELQLPSEPGTYQLRYELAQDARIIATREIVLTETKAELTAPETADVSSTIEVAWTGPDFERDYISIGVPGENRYVNYSYTREGNPVDLLIPSEPGTYELRYQTQQDGAVLAVRPITVADVTANIDVPTTARIGEPLPLTWQGPGYDRDFLSIARPGENYISYAYTNEGSPATLAMPPEPGDYVIRYQLRQDQRVLFEAPIRVEPVKAQLVAPQSVPAGSDVPVGWDGPAYERDAVGFIEPGGRSFITNRRVSTGNPVMLQAPDTPGEYELQYWMNAQQTVLARIPITVTE